jgi:hypothetical protein
VGSERVSSRRSEVPPSVRAGLAVRLRRAKETEASRLEMATGNSQLEIRNQRSACPTKTGGD